MVLTNEQLAHDIALHAMVDLKRNSVSKKGLNTVTTTYYQAYNHVYTQTLKELEAKQNINDSHE